MWCSRLNWCGIVFSRAECTVVYSTGWLSCSIPPFSWHCSLQERAARSPTHLPLPLCHSHLPPLLPPKRLLPPSPPSPSPPLTSPQAPPKLVPLRQALPLFHSLWSGRYLRSEFEVAPSTLAKVLSTSVATVWREIELLTCSVYPTEPDTMTDNYCVLDMNGHVIRSAVPLITWQSLSCVSQCTMSRLCCHTMHVWIPCMLARCIVLAKSIVTCVCLLTAMTITRVRVQTCFNTTSHVHVHAHVHNQY